MQLSLVDIDASVVAAWRIAFRAFPEVSIRHADILSVAENTVVSPANSYGFMDGGIDAAYLEFFGAIVQSRVQEAISRRPEGHLPVGASTLVRTGNRRIPYMIVAPTMTTPEAVEADHAYRAMRAVLRIASSDEKVGTRVFCPGLATWTGRVSAEDSARKMAAAYRDWLSAR